MTAHRTCFYLDLQLGWKYILLSNLETDVKIFFPLIFMFLVSCSDEYELVVEPEQNELVKTQKYHLNINGEVSFPTERVTKSFDPENDYVEVIKIQYIPIKKWPAKFANNGDNEWGQAGIRMRIVRKGSLFFDDEVIYEQSMFRFYNPNIVSISESDEAKIREINQVLDSGLGSGIIDNALGYNDYRNPIFSKTYLNNSEENYYHTLINKKAPRVSGSLNTLADLATSDNETKLPVDDLSRCTMMYPFNAARVTELKNF